MNLDLGCNVVNYLFDAKDFFFSEISNMSEHFVSFPPFVLYMKRCLCFVFQPAMLDAR